MKKIETKGINAKELQYLKALSTERKNAALRDEVYLINTTVKLGNEFYYASNAVEAGYINKVHEGDRKDKLEENEQGNAPLIPLDIFKKRITSSPAVSKYKGDKYVDTSEGLPLAFNCAQMNKDHKKAIKRHSKVMNIEGQWFDTASVLQVARALSSIEIESVNVSLIDSTIYWNVEKDGVVYGGAVIGLVGAPESVIDDKKKVTDSSKYFTKKS